ncbi:MAG: hypothetical protein Q9213_006198 [Squamulea squamosa]
MGPPQLRRKANWASACNQWSRDPSIGPATPIIDKTRSSCVRRPGLTLTKVRRLDKLRFNMRLTRSDDLIKLHKSIINTTADANSALRRALATANKALVKQKQFGTEVERFQQQLTQDLEASKTKTQSYLGTLMKNIESTLQNTIKPFSDKVKKVETEAENVQNALRSSAAEANELRVYIGKFIQQAVEGTAELAVSQTGHLEATSSSTAQLRNSLQSMRDQQVQSLLGAFNSIHNQIQISNELVGVMYSRQNDLDERLVNLDRFFAGLESSAAALHETHTAEAEAQLRLRNQLQVELQVAQGLIADITASAASLQASLHNTSSKVAHIVAFGGLSDRILTWVWCLVALLILWQFNARYARYAAATLGAFALISWGGLPDLTNRLSAATPSTLFSYPVPSEYFYIGLLFCCVIIGIFMLYRSFSRSQQLVVSNLYRVTSTGNTSCDQPHYSCKV